MKPSQKGTNGRIGGGALVLTADLAGLRRGGDPNGIPINQRVPAALRTKPFNTADAQSVGVTRAQLRAGAYRRLGSGIYRWAGLKESPQLMLAAVARRLPGGAAFSGRTAAWLHGLDVEPCDPVEVTIPDPSGGGRRAGASVCRAALAAGEIVLRRRLPTTNALRTTVDLGGRNPLTEAVLHVDLFLHAELVSVTELGSYVVEHPGAKGIAPAPTNLELRRAGSGIRNGDPPSYGARVGRSSTAGGSGFHL